MTLAQAVPAYVPFEVEVAAVRRLSPSFVRVTFTGPELHGFGDGGPLGTRDTRLKLVIPDAPDTPPRAPLDVTAPDWYRRWLSLDPCERGHLRTYTARAFRDDGPTAELDVDFVLHLDGGGHGGPATVWASRARPGDRLTLLGPNREHPDPGGAEWRPPRAAADRRQQVLLVGDETALPAIAGILEKLPEQYVGDAVVELPCLEDVQPLRRPHGVRLAYLPRHDRPRGVATLQALESLLDPPGSSADANGSDGEELEHTRDLDPALLWETPEGVADRAGVLYAWVAGEASVVRQVRRALVGRYRLDRSEVAFMGYWRQGRCEG